MLALQTSIGALNDLADVGIDSGRKPGKPLPRGVVAVSEAGIVVVLGLVVGLGLSALSGPVTALVAGAGVACGYLYDLRLSRTPWSWVPLAVALPLVPVHAWVGVSGGVPADLIAIVPAGMLAGAALALGNGVVDEARDRAAGIRTAAVALGRERAVALAALGLAGSVAIALALGPALGGGEGQVPGSWRTVAMALAAGVMAIGLGLSTRPSAALRERGWELEATGVVLLGVAWLAGLAVLPRA